jgi:hypothetical protein
VWLAEYLDWLMTSPLGQAEAREANNHGTCYDVQVVALAMHTGRGELAKDVLAAVPERRIRTQVTPEGEQPRELARTRAWTYSLKNLCALLNLADWGRQLDVDVWGYRSDDGRCISRVVDWMMPFALGERPWKHPELGGFQGSAGFLVLARAGQFPGGERYAEALRGIGVAMDDLCLKLVAQCPLGAVGASGGRRGFH